MKVYAVILTDIWEVDYITAEIYDNKNIAEKRAKELTDSESGAPEWYYEFKEFEINKKYRIKEEEKD